MIFLKGLILCSVVSSVHLLTHPDPNESFCTTLDGRDGVCISTDSQLIYCPSLKKLLKSRDKNDWEKLRQSFCSENIRNGRVCCPIEGPEGYEDDFQYDPEPDYTKHKNWEHFSLNNTRCGQVSTSSRVLGGMDAQLGQFPWMARIGYLETDSNGSRPIFSCSGTIINKRYILTAAHCLLPHINGYELAPVRLAETDESINPESNDIYKNVYYEDFDIESVHVHPNYTGKKTSPHDIAILRLKREVNLTNPVTSAVCLPFTKEFNVGSRLNERLLARNRFASKSMLASVAGWGKTENSNSSGIVAGSSILQHLMLPVQPSIICRILYANSNFSRSQLCVGGEHNKNSCWGDSGGPLTFSTEIPSKMYKNAFRATIFQIGIVSYGRSECGQKGVPVVYTRVRSYLTWILDTVKE